MSPPSNIKSLSTTPESRPLASEESTKRGTRVSGPSDGGDPDPGPGVRGGLPNGTARQARRPHGALSIGQSADHVREIVQGATSVARLRAVGRVSRIAGPAGGRRSRRELDEPEAEAPLQVVDSESCRSESDAGCKLQLEFALRRYDELHELGLEPSHQPQRQLG